MMIRMTWLATALMFATSGVTLADDPPETWDGLVEVKSKRLDVAYLAPGADFRPYTAVMVDPTEVAFKKDWMKDVNRAERSVSRRVTEEDAQEILAAARSNFDDIFQEAFKSAGYSVVDKPGAEVLRVSTAVINLYLNAPDTMAAGRSRTYSANAGEATLVLELRDSATGALLGRVLDRNETRDAGMMQMTSSVTNLSDFRALFKQWAGIAAKGLETLKSHSPIPEDLKPGQKL